MSNQNVITTADAAAQLPPGSWVVDDNGAGKKLCLVQTHMGAPQLMWMAPGGSSFQALDMAVYPLARADYVGDCEHAWGSKYGHCRRCGEVVAAARPFYFTRQGWAAVRAAAAANALIDGKPPR